MVLAPSFGARTVPENLARPVVPPDLKRTLVALATAEGFSALRVTTPSAIGIAGDRLRAFLADGRHGSMDWMAANADRRADPQILWPDVRSVLMFGWNYTPAENPIATLVSADRGVISAYARSRDYHDVIKAALRRVAGALQQATGADVKIFVDTAPLMEKPLAQAAGLGWQGKHTNLVARPDPHTGQSAGSWLFLGAILTTALIEPDAPESDHCGSCTRCLDACPTQAFPAPYQLDARRCIAYLTIEHKDPIPLEFRPAIGNRVFGCDDCLAVCPWNKFAAAAHDHRMAARAETDNPPLQLLLTLDDAAFRQRFAGTPIKRTGRNRFLRNVLIAAGNSGDASLLPHVDTLLADAAPLVRGMAVWALRQLGDAHTIAAAGALHRPQESDPTVCTEWDREDTP